MDLLLPNVKEFFLQESIHLEAFKRIQAIGIRFQIFTIDSRRLLAESTNGMADHSLIEVFSFD